MNNKELLDIVNVKDSSEALALLRKSANTFCSHNDTQCQLNKALAKIVQKDLTKVSKILELGGFKNLDELEQFIDFFNNENVKAKLLQEIIDKGVWFINKDQVHPIYNSHVYYDNVAYNGYSCYTLWERVYNKLAQEEEPIRLAWEDFNKTWGIDDEEYLETEEGKQMLKEAEERVCGGK